MGRGGYTEWQGVQIALVLLVNDGCWECRGGDVDARVSVR